MKKIDLAQTIGILANVGVLFGIVFLAFEVRQTGDALHAQMADSVAGGFITLNMATISDPQVANVWITGLYQPDSLTTTEAVQFSMYMRGLFNQYERLHDLYEIGLMDETDWEFHAREIVAINSMPGGRAHRERNEMSPKLAQGIAPYLDSERAFDFALGRDVPSSE